MSDEDRDVDIESDDEDGAATQFMTQAEKRAHHNALERKRRDHIKESFHGLRDVIPSLQGEKSSRAQILKQATDYIDYMTTKNLQTSQDIDDLKRQNGKLEHQVRAFEKAKNTGKYAAAQLKKLHAGLDDDDGDRSDIDDEGGVSSDEDEDETTQPTQRKKLRTH